MSFSSVRQVSPECMNNAVLYCRFSSDKQTENSIDFQLRANKEYCDKKGFNIVGEYIDRAMTGTNDDRPEFQKMIIDARSGQFAFVIVYRFDRFARNRYDSAIYKKQLANYGVRVLSTEESVGTGDEGIILEAIYEAMAESYSRRLSRVVTKGMLETARKGLCTGGQIAYGYKIVDHKLVIDDKTAPVVRMIFELYNKGKTKSEIANELNSRGYRTVRHLPFKHNSITCILNNRIYIGENNFKDIERSCPSIIDPALFNDVQKLIARNKKSYGRKASTAFFSLSGKLFCGLCGAAMTGDEGTSRSGAKYFYYSCGNKKRKHICTKKSEKKDFIEWYVCEQTINNVLTKNNIKMIAEKVVDISEHEFGADELSKAEYQLSAIDKEFDILTDKLISTNSALIINKINERAETLEKQKAELIIRISDLKLNSDLRITVPEVEEFLNSFRSGDLFNVNFRERLIRTLINCVYLWDDKLCIYYNIRGLTDVSYIDTISVMDSISECSVNSSNGSPIINLSEQACIFFKNGTFGLVISRGK